MDFKLAWVDEDNKKVLHSKMFETLEAAIGESANHKDFFIFSLNQMDSGEYSWDLLPYGMSTWYQIGLTAKEYLPLIVIGVGALIALSLLIRSSGKDERTVAQVL